MQFLLEFCSLNGLIEKCDYVVIPTLDGNSENDAVLRKICVVIHCTKINYNTHIKIMVTFITIKKREKNKWGKYQ